MPFVKINEADVHFKLRRSRRVRRLSLAVRGDKIELVAPLRVSNQDALRFLWQNRRWMFKQHQSLLKKQDAHLPFSWPDNFLAHETIPFRGERLTLQVKFGLKSVVIKHDDCLIVTVALKSAFANLDQSVKRLIYMWLVEQAEQLVQETIQEYCPRLGRWPTGFQIKRQKSRWGSCGISQKIYLNWLLILAPVGILEYVVVHELCHLFYRNHGPRFWGKVEQCMPDYAFADKWLNKVGHVLQRLSV